VRVFLDANILFSATKSDGALRRLLGLLIEAGHVCCVDDYVVDEARRNLARKGVEGLAVLDALLVRVETSASLVPRESTGMPWDWLPAKDRPVLASAIRLRCDALLTGDRTDFGAGYGKSFGGVSIHSPRSLLERLFPMG
jgi:predicted nucleic acid-binding protein